MLFLGTSWSELGASAQAVKSVDFCEFLIALKELGVSGAIINEPLRGSVKK